MGGANVLGDQGSGGFFYRRYYDLPAHTDIYFSALFWAIDTWDGDENTCCGPDHWALAFDATVYLGPVMDQTHFGGGPLSCGNGGFQYVGNMQVYVQTAHSASSLYLQIISLLDEPPANESYGFRSITMLFIKSGTPSGTCQVGGVQETNPSPSLPYCAKTSCTSPCTTCWSSGTSNCFSCNNGAYWDGTRCAYCHPACSTCYGGTQNDCIDCSSQYYEFNEHTCFSTCRYPLVSLSSSPLTCSFRCAPGLYWSLVDYKCFLSCTYPLISTSVNTEAGLMPVCTVPCPVGQYLYWDGTCQTSYLSPLVSNVTSTVNLCIFPCSAPTPFLFWDTTCASSCPFPLQIQILRSKTLCT